MREGRDLEYNMIYNGTENEFKHESLESYLEYTYHLIAFIDYGSANVTYDEVFIKTLSGI